MIYYWDKKLKKRLHVLEADIITIKTNFDLMTLAKRMDFYRTCSNIAVTWFPWILRPYINCHIGPMYIETRCISCHIIPMYFETPNIAVTWLLCLLRHPILAVTWVLCVLRHAVLAITWFSCILRHAILTVTWFPCLLRHAILAVTWAPCILRHPIYRYIENNYFLCFNEISF